MAKVLPPLAKSELEIARIVWNLGEASVRQVHQALPNDRRLDFWTVQTYLRRLKEKGYLRTRRVGLGNVYSAAVQPKKVIRAVTDDFINRLFDGEVLPLFLQIIDSRGLDDGEVEELQARLDQLKGRNNVK